MSYQKTTSRKIGQAELAFSEAFERLKSNAPIRLNLDSRVSQNNVAKEAGCDPSALRKTRYPSLISEIQRWCQEKYKDEIPSKRKNNLVKRRKNRDVKKMAEDFKLQRDLLASMLLEADIKILALLKENARLSELVPSSNVRQLHEHRRTDK